MKKKRSEYEDLMGCLAESLEDLDNPNTDVKSCRESVADALMRLNEFEQKKSESDPTWTPDEVGEALKRQAADVLRRNAKPRKKQHMRDLPLKVSIGLYDSMRIYGNTLAEHYMRGEHPSPEETARMILKAFDDRHRKFASLITYPDLVKASKVKNDKNSAVDPTEEEEIGRRYLFALESLEEQLMAYELVGKTDAKLRPFVYANLMLVKSAEKRLTKDAIRQLVGEDSLQGIQMLRILAARFLRETAPEGCGKELASEAELKEWMG